MFTDIADFTAMCEGMSATAVADFINDHFTLLAGCNGAGKTTLLMILASVARPDEGSVELDSVSLASLPHRERARTITLIPQDADCPFEFTGRELVAMGRHPHMGRFSGATETDRTAVDRALQQVDAGDFADRSVHTLSGGELRRISIARPSAAKASARSLPKLRVASVINTVLPVSLLSNITSSINGK